MASGTQGRIFISYRRQESSWPARQLYEVLVGRFGADSVFKDVDDIEPGDDFVERITEAVAACDVLLALIGTQWLTMTDDQGRRRLDNPEDFVRLEVEAALSRGVRVVPILVDGAPMPRADQLPAELVPLTRRQAVEISAVGFNTDRLMETLANTLASRGPRAVELPDPARKDAVVEQHLPDQAREDAANPNPTGIPASAGTLAPEVRDQAREDEAVEQQVQGQPREDLREPDRPPRRWVVPVAAGVGLAVVAAVLVVLHPWTGANPSSSGQPSLEPSRTPSVAGTPTAGGSPVSAAGPLILAHRGGLEVHQFETQQAMEAAAAAGFSIETDVRYTSDGEAVLVHDEQATKGLDCGGRSIRVSKTTWADLKRYCHSKPTAKDGAQYDVPRLDDTLEGIAAASERAEVYLEVKTPLSTARRKEFLATPAKYGLGDRVVITSFHRDWLDQVRATDPNVRRMLFVSGKPVPARSLAGDGLYMVGVQQDLATGAYLADLHAIGLKVMVWTVNDPRQWATLVGHGPDVLMTDYPARFKDWLASR